LFASIVPVSNNKQIFVLTSAKEIVFFIIFLLIFISNKSFGGEKNDTVYLYNGDRITGEIKKFEYGILFLKTDAMGTLNIEFDSIKTFYSNKQFTIQLSSGLRFFGSIDTSRTDGHVNLLVNSFRIHEPISDITEFYPVEGAFWKRLDGSIDIGYSYTKASALSQLNFSGYTDYRVEKAYSRINVSSIFTDQKDKNPIRKQDYSIQHNRFFKKSWFAGGYIGGQQNSELGVASRYYGGIAFGKDVVQNNRNALSGAIGLIYTTEKSDLDSTIQSIEGAMQWRYKIFKFSDPEIDLYSALNAYPSFTSWGRIRGEFELKAKFELFSDFYFGLNFYYNLDSQPIDETASETDWGITSSIGYSW
jgi:hypothetical protein